MATMAGKPLTNSIEVRAGLANRSARCTFQALIASAGLSILFLVIYGGCNWITAQRIEIGSIYFQWERNIPFVPLLILPYMSIDLFFIAAPFLCRTTDALKV